MVIWVLNLGDMGLIWIFLIFIIDFIIFLVRKWLVIKLLKLNGDIIIIDSVMLFIVIVSGIFLVRLL